MLNIGDQIWLSGGYDMKPVWLENRDGYSATVLGFKQFDFVTQAIARLDQKIKLNKLESDIILMQLRYKMLYGMIKSTFTFSYVVKYLLMKMFQRNGFRITLFGLKVTLITRSFNRESF